MKNLYLERYASQDKLIDDDPCPDLGIIVTIPCYNEDGILDAIHSLLSCDLPEASVEILVLVNYSESDDIILKNNSRKTYEKLKELSSTLNVNKLKLYPLLRALPSKHAGVGLARKILMDEAVRRFQHISISKGIITGFDADCTCTPDYLREIEQYFIKNPKASGCSIYFEHPVGKENRSLEQQAAYDYELHLRCYIDALRWCGIPHAFQTIGSAMAVDHKAYQRQGGMNKRKAGEDFYFLHRIIREGNFGDLTTTKVIPSVRISERVPFGTGKAIKRWMETGTQLTYNAQSYKHLKPFTDQIPLIFENKQRKVRDIIELLGLSELMKSYLHSVGFEENLSRIIRQSSNYELFKKHFYQWFDGFKVMKFLHYSRESGNADVPVVAAAEEIRQWLGGGHQEDLLEWYRNHDRNAG